MSHRVLMPPRVTASRRVTMSHGVTVARRVTVPHGVTMPHTATVSLQVTMLQSYNDPQGENSPQGADVLHDSDDVPQGDNAPQVLLSRTAVMSLGVTRWPQGRHPNPGRCTDPRHANTPRVPPPVSPQRLGQRGPAAPLCPPDLFGVIQHLFNTRQGQGEGWECGDLSAHGGHSHRGCQELWDMQGHLLWPSGKVKAKLKN